jgi:hypothetical protein
VAAQISRYSRFPSELEVLIPASTVFLVDSVDRICVYGTAEGQEITIPRVKLTLFMDWYDFDLDRSPRKLIIGPPCEPCETPPIGNWGFGMECHTGD